MIVATNLEGFTDDAELKHRATLVICTSVEGYTDAALHHQ